MHIIFALFLGIVVVPWVMYSFLPWLAKPRDERPNEPLDW